MANQRQLRIDEREYVRLKELAQTNKESVSRIATEAIRTYLGLRDLVSEGNSIFYEDKKTGEKVRIIFIGADVSK
jgi:predicted transcriptional regulator